MKRCFVVGAGSIYDGDLPFQPAAEDLVIAADGGFDHLQKAGMVPHLLIGDFDSMPRPETLCETMVLPVEKDDTDMVFAVKEGFRRGYTHFEIYGGLGGERISHTLANLQLLSFIKQQGGHGVLVGGNTRMLLLKNETCRLSASPNGHCSLFALHGDATVTLEGLHYPLCGGILSADFPLGVSNRFVENQAVITVHQGQVLVVIE